METPNHNLHPSGEPGDEHLDKLISWLDFKDTTPNFLTLHNFPLRDLRTALQRAVAEIVETLDPELGSWIEMAKDKDYCVQVDKEEMYATRTVEWESLLPSQVAEFGRETTGWYLKDARQEIRWVRNEIGRVKEV
ncbi:hypothetical protein LTR37_020810 [Vermiconidia calcicola]|uniref:Uncharacterized protein n=1 Tax=Vermiconidia calcicola TaxID=1690605 RepID=A0ACC3MC89_9PEZI|nr:hypothetical protein LTR37_020810 [Vermiconidia calcicola]